MEAATKQFKKRNAILSCLRGTVLHPSAEMLSLIHISAPTRLGMI